MASVFKDRSLLVDSLVLMFGLSSWISINGLWVELPLIVNILPEMWDLASYLAVLVQVANLGPLLFIFFRWISKGRITYLHGIYVLLTVGTAAALMLPSFWERTTVIFGSMHSTGLFILVFFLSVVDCTSSVTFTPFMNTFKATYLYSFFIGEGLSGFIPSLAAIAQGVGGSPTCVNGTAIYDEPRFSVDVFFYFLAAMMVASSIAFILLNTLSVAKKEKVHNHPHEIQNHIRTEEEENRTEEPFATEETSSVEEGDRAPPSVGFQQCSAAEFTPVRPSSLSNLTTSQRRVYFVLLGIEAFLCFVSNGAFPSIQTYSCMPYGNVVYHLVVTLSSMLTPVMALFAFFVPIHKLSLILLITAIGSGFGGFILATAFNSPVPLFGQGFGGTLTVISWIIYGGTFSYMKVSIASMFRNKLHESSLFWYGVVTQLGSATGALLLFYVVNWVKPFEANEFEC